MAVTLAMIYHLQDKSWGCELNTAHENRIAVTRKFPQ